MEKITNVFKKVDLWSKLYMVVHFICLMPLMFLNMISAFFDWYGEISREYRDEKFLKRIHMTQQEFDAYIYFKRNVMKDGIGILVRLEMAETEIKNQLSFLDRDYAKNSAQRYARVFSNFPFKLSDHDSIKYHIERFNKKLKGQDDFF